MARAVSDLADLAARAGQPGPALSAIAELRERLAELEKLHVTAAREQGWSWSEIADALGVTRQAAHRKHAAGLKLERREDGRRRPALSTDARRCVVRARREAAAFGHDSVGTDHLLLGLLEEDRIARTLAPLGLTLERVLFAVTDLRGVPESARRPRRRPGAIPISRKARRVLDESGRGRPATPEDVLLALMREKDCAAGRALERAGVAPSAVEKTIRSLARSY